MQNLITNLKNNFLLYRLNYICRRFLTSSSIFNNILTSTKNSKNSKIMYQINTKESANYLVINNILATLVINLTQLAFHCISLDSNQLKNLEGWYNY